MEQLELKNCLVDQKYFSYFSLKEYQLLLLYLFCNPLTLVHPHCPLIPGISLIMNVVLVLAALAERPQPIRMCASCVHSSKV